MYDDYEYEPYEDDLLEWETEQVFQDGVQERRIPDDLEDGDGLSEALWGESDGPEYREWDPDRVHFEPFPPENSDFPF